MLVYPCAAPSEVWTLPKKIGLGFNSTCADHAAAAGAGIVVVVMKLSAAVGITSV